MGDIDKHPHIQEITKGIKDANSLEDFSIHLDRINKSDIIISERIREALLLKPKRVFCLLRRCMMEGRVPPSLSWIVPFQEYLQDALVQNELRTSGTMFQVLSEFIQVLGAKNPQENDIRDCLRVLYSTPNLSDYAWEELPLSPLKALSDVLRKTEDLGGLLTLALGFGSILKNKGICDVINSRSEEIIDLLTGKKNRLLALSFLGAITALDGNPWCIEKKLKKNEFKLLNKNLRESIMGRFSKSIPKRGKIVLEEDGDERINVQYIEESITKLGWAFVRNYLLYLAEVHRIAPQHLFPIAYSQYPLGRIQPNYIIYCLRKGIPVPYQVLRSALGSADEYILDITVIEADFDMKSFEADCPDLREIIPSRQIRENHLVNGRTGLRLDETYLGTRGIIRTLLDRKEKITTDIAIEFVQGLITSTSIPMAIKKRARNTLRLIEMP